MLRFRLLANTRRSDADPFEKMGRGMAENPGRRVELLHTLSLGGVKQAIHVCGDNSALPLLLFLHGGPGLPHMPFAHVNAELTKSFLVVHWDQCGTGKSYSPMLHGAHLSIEQLVADAHQLIEWLCARFGQTRVILAGHSWGSALGALVAARYPALIAAYVGIGQIANLRFAEKVRYYLASTLARHQGDRRAATALRRLGPPPYRSSHGSDLLERWACRLTGECHRPIADMQFLRLALMSPVYSWFDLLRIPLGVRFSQRGLWDEIHRELDLFRQVPRLEMPVYFLVGRCDAAGTHLVARHYFDALEAPRGKTFITFEGSGHWPHLEQATLFRAILAGPVRQEVVAGGLGGKPRRGSAERFASLRAA